jgi:inosine-uridine nucleoside N-ribohydrolase
VISVETGGEHSRGATWVDRRRIHADSSVRIGVNVDNEKFVALLRERFATYN